MFVQFGHLQLDMAFGSLHRDQACGLSTSEKVEKLSKSVFELGKGEVEACSEHPRSNHLADVS